jgi:WD40 repeat protein/predicted Ser/Thr protein kinase
MSIYLRQRYRLLKKIGKGGFCQTFIAKDEGKFPPAICVVQKLQQQTAAVCLQKLKLLEELGKHPQIPALLTYFAENQDFYLVQEYIEGKNLATLVEEQGTFSETQIWRLLESLLPVIKFVSNRHIIHQDIKPENIILRASSAANFSSGSGDFVLVDFGAATFLSKTTYPAAKKGIGSPEYAAFEQAQGQPIFASDLYSLGVTCIYLLTQISPFDLFDTVSNSWVWRQYLITDISERLGKILDKMIEKVASDRFQSADQVMQAMGISSHIPNPLPRIPNGQCLYTLATYPGLSSSVNSIAVSAICDGDNQQQPVEILASAHDDKTVKLWNLNTRKLIYTLAKHDRAVNSVAFSPDGKILATASDDKTIKLWNANTWEQTHTLTGHINSVKSLAFSPYLGKNRNLFLLASGSWDKTVKLWNVKTGEEICTLLGHQLQVSTVAFSPNVGDNGCWCILASASYDRTVRVWDLSSLVAEISHSLPARNNDKLKNCPNICFFQHTWAVLTVAFSPDGKILATGSDDNTIKLWDVNTGQLIRTLRGHSWSVLAVTFDISGEALLSASRDNTIKVWRVSTGEEIATLTGHVDSVSAVAVSPGAQLIASGSRDKTIKLWKHNS